MRDWRRRSVSVEHDEQNSAFLALGGLKELHLDTADAKLVELYNAIIGRVAREFEAIGQELDSIHGAIAAEAREQLSREARS